ncbi:MAG: hypothetical protein WC891_00095 [Actinomycetota bacterium]
MSSKREEPVRLKKGKLAHKDLQNTWQNTAEGTVETEKAVHKPGGGRGRIDIHVESDGNLVAVVEVKDSDWDAMTPQGARRNVQRQIRQIWKYVESQLSQGKDVSPGIVFPKRPSDPERVELIESMFGEECIAVVWDDE